MHSFHSALLQVSIQSRTKLATCWNNDFVRSAAYKRPSNIADPVAFAKRIIVKPKRIKGKVFLSPIEDDEELLEEKEAFEREEAKKSNSINKAAFEQEEPKEVNLQKEKENTQHEAFKSPPKVSKDIWLCNKGREQTLIQDLQSIGKNMKSLKCTPHDGFVETLIEGRDLKYQSALYLQAAWARQLLPRCTEITGNSINNIAQSCFEVMIPKLEHWLEVRGEYGLKWTIHPLSPEDSNLNGRVKILHKAIIDLFKEKRKSFHKTFDEKVKEPTTGLILFQLFMHDKNSIFIADSFASFNGQWGWKLPLPFPNGIPPIDIDKAPPSRAYKKLEEIFALFHNPGRTPVMVPDSLCAELGAAPGGWTTKLLERKMQVIAVDRSRLDLKIPRSPNLVQVIADGASWLPKEPVDWVLSDMSIPPEKSLNSLLFWIREKKASRFIWTLKFTGNEYGVISEAREKLTKLNCDFAIRHLANHGNEVCVLGAIQRTVKPTQ